MKPQRNNLCTPKEFPLKDITERTISCAIEVHSTVDIGLLENVYEKTLSHEFKHQQIWEQ